MKGGMSLSPIPRLAENIWSKASAAPSDSVCLWLGRWMPGMPGMLVESTHPEN